MQKVKNYFKRNAIVFLSGFVALAIMTGIFIINDSWPFGTNGCANFDYKAQIVPFLNMINDILRGGSSIFYSNKLGAGASIYSAINYCIISPVHVLIVLLGPRNAYYTANIIFAVDVCFIATSMSWALKKLFPNLNKSVVLMFALGYSFGGFVLLNLSYQTWLTFLILTPILFVTFKRLVDTGKYLAFGFISAWMIVTCYGVGATSVIFLVALYYLYIKICVDKDKQKETLVKLTLALFIAVTLSLVVILPAFIESRYTARNGDLFSQIFTLTPYNEIYDKFGFILYDFPFTIISLIFLFFSNKKDKTNKFLGIALIILSMITWIDASMLLFNFGKYLNFASRLSFIYSTMIVIVSAKLITDKSKQKNESKNVVIKNKTTPVWLKCLIYCVIAVILIVGVLFIANILNKKDSLKFMQAESNNITNFITDSEIELIGHFIKFAVITDIIAMVVLFITRVKKSVIYKVGACVLIATQLVMSVALLMNAKSNALKERNYYDMYQSCDEYDRLYGFNKNASAYALKSGIGMFSSMISLQNINTLGALGYENKLNSVGRDGGTIFTDSILGIKYYSSSYKINSPMLTLLESRSYEESGQKFNQYLYKSNYVLSGSYLLDKNYEWNYNLTAFENQNNLAKVMGATHNLFNTCSLYDLVKNSNDLINYSSTNIYQVGEGLYRGESETTSCISISLKYDNQVLYYTMKKAFTDNCSYVSTDMYNTNDNCVYSIGKNSAIMLRLKKGAVVDFNDIKIGVIKYATFIQEYANIKANEVNIDYVKDGFKFKQDLDSDKILFTTNVNIRGLTCKVNGKKSEIFDYACGFIGISLKAGYNSVKVGFLPPFFWPTLLAMFVCFGISIAGIVLLKKYKRFKWLEKIIDRLYLAYFIVFAGVILVFCPMITIYKAVLLL